MFHLLIASAVMTTARAASFDDVLDLVDDKLTLSLFDDRLRSRLSGTLDLEGYHLPEEFGAVIESKSRNLFAPRLTLFLDSQVGSKLYSFAQFRVDRGFDPGDHTAQVRFDEYAFRLTPWDDGRFSLQAGKFGTVVGNWMVRHLSWDNPFITAPLAYENVTGISDSEVASSVHELRDIPTEENYEHNPIIWGPSYASGVQMSGKVGWLDCAVELKNASLSSRPESWDSSFSGFGDPTVSGRIGLHPGHAWNFGFSFSDGNYFKPGSASDIPAPFHRKDFRQQVLAQDASFAWGHVQVWAELFESRFRVPGLGDADTVAGYLEVKYKFNPQWFAAVRWNQQLFADMKDPSGEVFPWGGDTQRLDVAIGHRPSAHTQIKLQWNGQHERYLNHEYAQTIAAQFTLRF